MPSHSFFDPNHSDSQRAKKHSFASSAALAAAAVKRLAVNPDQELCAMLNSALQDVAEKTCDRPGWEYLAPDIGRLIESPTTELAGTLIEPLTELSAVASADAWKVSPTSLMGS